MYLYVLHYIRRKKGKFDERAVHLAQQLQRVGHNFYFIVYVMIWT